ncbi:MAG: hypothetical protein QGI92_02690 [Dehalococcoidales bacterium]|nr:hypothetical protein [Dehalococcoidales bacterium]MDP7409550.1 hypothetical protein [Dehalococcoidales bacterium]MDP7675884.1 hypothetical protein [Dehalococcoidales bacterium]HJM36597.1 hypothetical protein [Dehalococcoidales bacterium]
MQTDEKILRLKAISAMCLLFAGGDILVMRHPETMRLVSRMIAELTKTG